MSVRHTLAGMSRTWERILDLVARGEILISEHGHDELSDWTMIRVRDIVGGVSGQKCSKTTPPIPKVPALLVLERDRDGRPLHAVWGIPRGAESPAVLVTAYRPDTTRWSDDFKEEAAVKKRRTRKLVHVGLYAAEVEVDLIDADEGWSPYLSVEDAYKLDDVRDALRRGDLAAAARQSRVFTLTADRRLKTRRAGPRFREPAPL